MIPMEDRLGKFIQAADEEQVVSSAPPLPIPAGRDPGAPKAREAAMDDHQRVEGSRIPGSGSPFAGPPDDA